MAVKKKNFQEPDCGNKFLTILKAKHKSIIVKE